jgi:hypothetical protein
MAHDVFISHAYKDKGIAQAICEKLESEEVRCWMTARDISASEDQTEATRNAIGSSRVMLLVLSENANAAPHVEREIAHAFYTRRTIVPLRLANTLPRRDFLFYLGSARWFNAFSPSAKQHLAALTEHIKRLIPDRTAAANGVPHRTARGTTTRSNLSNAWPGEFRPPHYRMLGILSWVTIAACLFLIWLLCFAPNQMKEALQVANSNPGPTSSLPSAPLTPSAQAKGKTPDSNTTPTFTRFGLWEPPNTGPTPLAQLAPDVTPAVAPSRTPHVDQNAASKPKEVAIQHGESDKSATEGPPRKTSRQRSKLTSSGDPDALSVSFAVPPVPKYSHPQYNQADRSITWHGWQELPGSDVSIRTGDRYLGRDNWAHYLTLELGPASQQVIKVSLIRLQGETAADTELSPTARDAIVTIVNHSARAEKGAWSWTLQAEPQTLTLAR